MNNLTHIIKILLKNPALLFGGVVMLALVIGLGFVMTKSQTTTENRSKATGSTVARVYLVGGTDVDSTKPGIQVAEKPNATGVGAIRSDVQQFDIKLDTGGKKVIAVDLTVSAPEYAIKTIESVKFTGGRANGELFQQMAMFTPSAAYVTKEIRFLVLAKPGETVTGDGRNIGNIQFQFIRKKTTGVDPMESIMGFSITKASIVTDAEVINISSPNTLAGGQLSYELVNPPIASPTLAQSAPTDTPAPVPTDTPAPPYNPAQPTSAATPTPLSSSQGSGSFSLPSATPTQTFAATPTVKIEASVAGKVCAKNINNNAVAWCYDKTTSKPDCYSYGQNARLDSEKACGTNLCCTGQITE